MRILRSISLAFLSLLFVGAGITHFALPSFFTTLMPPWLPHWLHVVAGAFEILLGLLLLHRCARRFAGVVVLLMLTSFLLVHGWHLTGTAQATLGIPAGVAWARFAGQFVLMAWVWWAAVKPTPISEAH